MKKEIQEHITEGLRDILNSRSSNLSKKDTAKLAALIEKIKNIHEPNKFKRIIQELLDFFT